MSALPWLAIVGPTASGKSALALEIARRERDVELLSADAMQVYRGMDIGTAKPTPEERADVPHHLLDIADPSEDFSLAEWQRAAKAAIADVHGRGRRTILVGGTGLYVRALLDDLDLPGRFPDARAEVEAEPDTLALHRRLSELDPTAATRMEPTNRRRIVRALEVAIGSGRPFSSFGPGLTEHPEIPTRQLGIQVPTDELDVRIEQRVRAMVEAGLVEEVEALAARPAGLSRTARQALGYKELLEHLDGRCTLDQAIDQVGLRTRQLARRQVRWFRRDPRIRWGSGPASAAWARALA